VKVALALLIVTELALAGCGKPRAVTQPDLPSLAPPSPPPRVIVPPGPEPTPATPPPASQPAEAPKPPPRRAAPKPEPSQPIVTPPAKPDAPPTPPTLQATPPGGEAEIERQTRALLAQAERDLRRVTYKALNADGKAQFDTAKRLAEQAQQALKEKNFAFAQRLADKAATLASGLVGR
jgi:hypothetical protein